MELSVSPSPDAEDSIYQAAKKGLTRWLSAAREKVMAPFRRFRSQPNPEEIYSTVPIWQEEVDRIASALTPALREGWDAVNLPGHFSVDDPYIQANIAMTKNLLVRIPNEVHTLVVREILEGASNQESVEQIAARVDDVLTFTGSENWDNRSKVIAATEVNRHYNSALLAHGLKAEQQGRRGLMKRWDTRMDGRERLWHHDANGQVRPLGQPFLVGGEALLFPVDPKGRADNVIACRCALEIMNI